MSSQLRHQNHAPHSTLHQHNISSHPTTCQLPTTTTHVSEVHMTSISCLDHYIELTAVTTTISINSQFVKLTQHHYSTPSSKRNYVITPITIYDSITDYVAKVHHQSQHLHQPHTPFSLHVTFSTVTHPASTTNHEYDSLEL